MHSATRKRASRCRTSHHGIVDNRMNALPLRRRQVATPTLFPLYLLLIKREMHISAPSGIIISVMLSSRQPAGALSLPPPQRSSPNKLLPDLQKSILQAFSNTPRSSFRLSIDIFIITPREAFAGSGMNKYMSHCTVMRVPSRRPATLSQSDCTLWSRKVSINWVAH